MAAVILSCLLLAKRLFPIVTAKANDGSSVVPFLALPIQQGKKAEAVL